ncbi:hypothetical protein J9R20_004563 [Salmonella enterica]|nr:hypothetical protein [Salmonella enterica]
MKMTSSEGHYTPEKSRQEMDALCALPGVESADLPGGKLSFYEEFPEETVRIIHQFALQGTAGPGESV